MRIKIPTVIAFASALALSMTEASGQAQTTSAPARVKCRHVTARTASDLQFDGCTSPVGLCTLGTMTGDSWLNGTFQFIAPALGPSAGLPASIEPESTLSYGGTYTVVGTRGSITYQVIGVYDTALQIWTEIDRVLSGTGKFAGARGVIYINGVGLDGGTHLEGDVSGDICIPR